jgi:hypothetical protein
MTVPLIVPEWMSKEINMEKYSRRGWTEYFAHSTYLKAINDIVTNHIVFDI